MTVFHSVVIRENPPSKRPCKESREKFFNHPRMRFDISFDTGTFDSVYQSNINN